MAKRCLIAAFSLVATLWLPLPSAYGQSYSPLVTKALDKLDRAGFDSKAILVKETKKGNLKIQLLRIRSGPRLYDLSIVADDKFFLAVSYDDGKKFGRIRNFEKLTTVVSVIDRIEQREVERAKKKGGGADGLYGDSKSDQRSGIKERAAAAKKKQKEAAKKAGGALGNLVGGGGGEGEVGSVAAASGGGASSAVDKQSRDYSSKFGQSACATETGGSLAEASGGVASASKQLGEAAIATSVAEAFAMGLAGLGEGTGIDVAADSRFFDGNVAGTDVVRLMDGMPLYKSAGDNEKQQILRGVLATVIRDDIDVPKQYRVAEQLHVRFRRWTVSEGFNQTLVRNELKALAKRLHVSKEAFKQHKEYYFGRSVGDVFVNVEEKIVMVDPNAANPAAAIEAFFRGVMLFLRATTNELQTNRDEVFKVNREMEDYSTSIFEENPEQTEALQGQRAAVFKKAAANKKTLLRLLEENAISN